MAKHTRKMKIKKNPKNFSSENSEKTSNVPEKSSSDGDSILDYFNLCTKFETHIIEYRRSWKFVLEENLVFYKIDTTNHPKIIASIKIDKNLKVHVFMENGEVKGKYLASLLNEKVVLQYWTQLKNLLQHFGMENIHYHVSIKKNLQHALKCLQKCTENKSLKDNIALKSKLQFIFSQVYALTDNKYTQDILSLAYSIYLKSSSCYNYLQSLDSITLPKEEDLVKYVQ